MKDTIFLSQEDVKRCIMSFGEAIDIVEDVFRLYGSGKVFMPSEVSMNLLCRGTGTTTEMGGLPACIKPWNVVGIKWNGDFFDNPARYSLPWLMTTIILNDSRNGLPLAIMDGTLITAVRTAAVTAVAAKYLARDDSAIIGIVGAGAQGRSTLKALHQIFAIRKVKVVDLYRKVSRKYASNMQKELNLDVESVATAQEATEESDIILTATTANEPLVKNEWVKPGAFVVSIGGSQELYSELLLAADKIVVDSLVRSKRSGELVPLIFQGLIRESDISELWEIVVGRRAGRVSEKERVIGSFTGIGSNDVALGFKVYEEAKKQGLGARFNFL